MEDSLITIQVNAKLLRQVEKTIENEEISLSSLVEIYLGLIIQRKSVPEYIRIYEEEVNTFIENGCVRDAKDEEKVFEIGYDKILDLINEDNNIDENDRCIEIKVYSKTIEAVEKIIEGRGYTLSDVINVYFYELGRSASRLMKDKVDNTLYAPSGRGKLNYFTYSRAGVHGELEMRLRFNKEQDDWGYKN